jgi:hypothetical protein
MIWRNAVPVPWPRSVVLADGNPRGELAEVGIGIRAGSERGALLREHLRDAESGSRSHADDERAGLPEKVTT